MQNRIEPGALDGISNLKSLTIIPDNSFSSSFNANIFEGVELLENLAVLDRFGGAQFNIESGAFQNLKELKTITIHAQPNGHKYYSNKIMDDAFEGLPSIEKIDFPGDVKDRISFHWNVGQFAFRGVTEKIISRVPELFTVVLDICDRGRIGEIIAGEVNAKCDNVPVESLKNIWSLFIVGDKKLTKLPRGSFKDLPSLRTVEIHNSEIQQMEPGTFDGTTNFLGFILIGAPLTEILPGTFRGLDKVWSITIRETKLKELHAGTFEGVSEDLLAVDLKNNEIKSIDPKTFRDVFLTHKIYLSYNRIEKIASKTFFNLPNLMTLQISDNDISEIGIEAFSDLPKLVRLGLDSNKISFLSKDMFRLLPKLDTLSLSRNRIVSIPRHAFEAAPRLDGLYLSKNQLRDIQTFAFMGASIKTLLLCENHDLKSEDLQPVFSGLSKDARVYWDQCWD